MSKLQRYLIMVDKNYQQQLPEIAQKLETCGCQIEQIMDQLGVIGVSITEDHLDQLYQVEGVVDITSGEEEFHAI